MYLHLHLGREPFKTFLRCICNQEGGLFCRWFAGELKDSSTALIPKIYFLWYSSVQVRKINEFWSLVRVLEEKNPAYLFPSQITMLSFERTLAAQVSYSLLRRVVCMTISCRRKKVSIMDRPDFALLSFRKNPVACLLDRSGCFSSLTHTSASTGKLKWEWCYF